MKSIAPWRAAVGSVVLLAACGGGNVTPRDAAYEPMPQEPMPVDTGGNDALSADGVDGAQCAIVIEQHPQEGAQPYPVHIPCTGPTDFQTVPPSSGNHFQCWPEYRTFDVPVPWGNLVHGLEHGAVIIVYNCGSGQDCVDEVARAQALIDTLPPDPTCGTARRVILAPDPTLPVRWAASAWTWTLQADCFDETAFAQFYVDHVGHTYEDLCNPGAPYANLCDGAVCM